MMPSLLIRLLPFLCASMSRADTNDTAVQQLFFLPRSPEHYHSSQVTFDPKGMEHLYLLTNWFLDWVQPQGLPPGMVTKEIFREPLQVLDQNRTQIINFFLGLLLVGLGVGFVGLLVPIGGVFYCCCCSTPNKSRRYEKRRMDAYKRAFYGTFLLGIILLMMFCVISAFMTNEYTDQGIRALPATLNNSVDDMDKYLNNTKHEIDILLKKNFKQLEEMLHQKLDKTGEVIHSKLLNIVGIGAIDNLSQIVSSLDMIQTRLTQAMGLTREMQRESEELQSSLAEVRRDLDRLLEGCPPPRCPTKYNISVLTVVPDLHKLPNLTHVIQDISFLLRQNIEGEIKKGKAAFDRLSQNLQKSVNRSIPEIKDKLRQVGQELSRIGDNINSFLHVHHNYHEPINHIEPLSKEYVQYRWYVCLGICCGLALIVTCFTIGLIYGCCGHSLGGDAYGESGCSKLTGSRFLILGVVFVFLLSTALLLATAAMFITGGVAERGVCDLLHDPTNPQTEKVIRLLQEEYYPLTYKMRLGQFLRQCHHNSSLYRALELSNTTGPWTHSLTNISSLGNYRQRYGIDRHLDDFVKNLVIQPNVVVLSPQGEALLARLKDLELNSINYTLYTLMARQHITEVSLPLVALHLRSTAAILPYQQRKVSSELREIASHLDSYDAKLAIPIMEKLEKLRQVAEQLKKDTQFEGQTLPEAINALLRNAVSAQNVIKAEGREEIKKMAQEIISDMADLMDTYSVHVKNQVERGVGKCQPLSQAFNASLIAVCKEIVLPMNGYWASVGVCTLLGIPGMILASILTTLYKKMSITPRHESQYDAYLDRNKILYAHGGRKYRRRMKPEENYPSSYREPPSCYAPPDHSTPSAPNAETHIWDTGDDFNKPPPYFYPAPRC